MTILKTDLRFKYALSERPATHRIVCHHTAGPAGQDVRDIHAYHLSRGWNGVGYGILQASDGQWYEGRGLDKEGAHATGHNRNSLGIALIGNLESEPLTAIRWSSLVMMCVELCERYGLDYTDVVGHNELPGAQTLCPGKHLDMRKLREAINQRLVIVPSRDIYRVIVDGRQVGAYGSPQNAVIEALVKRPSRIEIVKT